MISDPDNIRTPGSTNRPTGTTETNRRTQNATMRFNIPTTQEINEFFQSVEEEQQKEFMEKYVVNFLLLRFKQSKIQDSFTSHEPDIMFTNLGLFAGTTLIPLMRSHSQGVIYGRELTLRRYY